MRSRDLSSTGSTGSTGARSPSRHAALLAIAGSMAACNVIFGIHDGLPTGSTTGGKGGAGGSGGASTSASASSSATTGSGGASSSASTTSTTGSTGAGGATGSGGATASSSSSTGGPMGPFCDGTDPADPDGTSPSFGAGERNGGAGEERGVGITLKSDGTMIMTGTYADADTKFDGHLLPSAANDGGAPWRQAYVAFYSPAPATSLTWVQSFNGPGDEVPTAITVDSGRNIVVVGSMTGALSLAQGTMQATTLTADTSLSASATDAFIARVDESGKLLFAKRISSPQNDTALAVGTDWDGSVLVAGVIASGAGPGPIPVDFGCGTAPDMWAPDLSSGPRSTVFVARYDPMGACVWHRFYDVSTGYVDAGNPGAPLALAFAQGDVFLAGGHLGTADTLGGQTLTQAGGADVFVARLHGDTGDHHWSRSYGDVHDQYATAIQVDPCGNVVLAGNLVGSAAFDATVLQDANAPGEQHAFVVKLAQQQPPHDQFAPGAPLWARLFTDHGTQDARSLSVNASAEIALGGILIDGPGSAGVDFGMPVGVLAGPAGATAGTSDGFVTKLDAAGKTRWARRTAGVGNEAVRSVSIDDEGHTGVTGDFDGMYDFGFGSAMATGTDMWFVEYASSTP